MTELEHAKYQKVNLDDNYNLDIGSKGVLTFYQPPPIVGYWVFPGSKKGWETKFSMYGKPNPFHRWMMRWVLGWVWEDVK